MATRRSRPRPAPSPGASWPPLFGRMLGRRGRTRPRSALELRDDSVYVNRLHTRYRARWITVRCRRWRGRRCRSMAPGGLCNADQVHLLDLGPYLDDTTHWRAWLRTVLGVREEYYRASDHSLTTGFSGATDETLLQPKASLILGPFAKTEVYFSAGRGFHSDDVRGVFGTVPAGGRARRRRGDAAAGADPGCGVRHSQRSDPRSCRCSWRCFSRTSIRS